MSSTWKVTTAFAPTFSWTAGATDFRLLFTGDPEVHITVPSGTYRMHLGPSSGDGQDFLRAAETQINAGIAGAGRSETVTLTMQADGTVKLVCSGAVTLNASPGLRALGLDAGGPSATFTAARGPQHLALVVSASGGIEECRDVASIATDGAGRVYSLGAITTAYQRPLGLDLIPWDPTAGADAESPATPWFPDRPYRGARGNTSVGRVWSWLDVLHEATNVETAAALWSWQSLVTSTTVTYDLVHFGEASVKSPKPERRHPTWNRWVRHQLDLWWPEGAPTGTRA